MQSFVWGAKEEYRECRCKDRPSVLELLCLAGVGEGQCAFDNDASYPVADEDQWSLESTAEVAVGVKVDDKLRSL
jgi:hypothetical protein